MEVLTLPEVAAYLRVPEEAVSALVAEGAIPARDVGGQWRFLKRAVAEWLRSGPYPGHEPGTITPAWAADRPVWEDLLRALEARILGKIPTPDRPPPERGSKQTVLKHFGVFQGDADVEDQLAGIRARREAAGE